MKVTINRDVFADVLSPAANVAAKSMVDYLACALIEAGSGTVTVTATDQTDSVSVTVPALVEEQGSALVPAKRLHGVVKSMPDGSVTVKCDDRASVSSGRANVTLPLLDPEDFPSFPDVESGDPAVIPAAQIADAVTRTSPFVYRKDDKPILTCVRIKASGGKIDYDATDSYRCIRLRGDCGEGLSFDAPIPLRLLHQIAGDAKDGDVRLSFSNGLVKAEYGETTRVSRLIEGQYPNVDVFLATERNAVAGIAKDALRSAVERSIVSCSGNTALAVEVLEGSVRMTRVGEGSEEFEEYLDAEFIEGTGYIRVSPHYLLDSVRSVDSDVVELAINAALRPLAVDGDKVKTIVMPVR